MWIIDSLSDLEYFIWILEEEKIMIFKILYYLDIIINN